MAKKKKSIEDIEEVKVGEFTAKFFWVYYLVQLFLQKPSRRGKPFHVRGFHYWITKLEESFKKLPSNNGHNQKLAAEIDNNRLNDFEYLTEQFNNLRAGSHIYTNTASMHSNLDKALTQLRLRGFIPFEMIRDKKNPDPIHRLEEILGELGFNYDISSLDHISECYESELKDFDRFSIDIYEEITESRFTHQDYFLLVVSEKDLYVEEISAVCAKHGAEYLYFSGQPSYTRMAQVCFKATATGKPILLLYLADLDPAGLIMSNAFRKRMHQIYPRDDHIVKRVMLTREQVVANGYPTMMTGDKKIAESVMEWFITKTGGDTLCELNALEEEDFIPILEAELIQYSGIEQDKEENEELVKESAEKLQKIKEKVSSELLPSYKNEYNKIKETHDKLAQKIIDFYDSIAEEMEELSNLKIEFKDKVSSEIEKIIEEINPEPES